jgi:hypothetical protein
LIPPSIIFIDVHANMEFIQIAEEDQGFCDSAAGSELTGTDIDLEYITLDRCPHGETTDLHSRPLHLRFGRSNVRRGYIDIRLPGSSL